MRWGMTPLLIALVCVSGPVLGQGAPLIDGLGGPVDLGEVHPGFGEQPLAPAMPDGVLFYRDRVDQSVQVNWGGSFSFGGFDDGGADPIPGPLFAEGFGLRRIVPLHHSSDLSGYELGDPDAQVTFIANQPPGDDGTPGRYIVTWYRVHYAVPSPRWPDLYNTWQAIITGPDPADYTVEFRYNQCEWTHGIGRPDRKSVMGFDGGEGPDGPGWMWTGSATDDVRLLCRLSNVREPGVFRYRIVDGLPTGCGIDADPPPGPGRCADQNHLPGDGCSPACYVEPDIDGDGRYEAPSPESPDPLGVYDDCTDPDEPACDDDPDGDGVPSIRDNCLDLANPEQRDYDIDGLGDACDIDADDDVLLTRPLPADPDRPLDICPLLYSAGTRRVDPRQAPFVQQPDIDRDGLGDACDPDDDGDGILDCGGDGVCNPKDDGYNNDFDDLTDEPDECDDCVDGAHDLFDNDGDGAVDEYTEAAFPFVVWPGPDEPPAAPEDNCRRIPNPDQTDTDGDAIGDACDPDIDGDGIPNCAGNGICGPLADGRDNDGDGLIDEPDECALGCDPAADRVDQDLDGYVDEEREVQQAIDDMATLPPPRDNCPKVANEDQADRDRDGIGDACADDDGDGLFGGADNCPVDPNPQQEDLDGDGIGDACDPDVDGDDVANGVDNCPRVAGDQTDTDGDGLGDVCDPDDDEDGINDPFDRCPLAFDPDQADLDGDGIGDVCDPDDDGDGAPDDADRCPRLADDQADIDGDGIGDACDEDDDGDGIADAIDGCPKVEDTDQADLDGDGIGDACDPTDDRPFAVRSPEEKCAILLAGRGPTAERLEHCPPPADDGCTAAPGGAPGHGLWLLLMLTLGIRGRRQLP